VTHHREVPLGKPFFVWIVLIIVVDDRFFKSYAIGPDTGFFKGIMGNFLSGALLQYIP